MNLRTRIGTAAMVGTLGLLAACGGGDAPSNLSEQAQRGYDISQSSGCFSCHGRNGSGGIGPKWQGLAGSQVELSDGSTVTADHDYLVRAITDPGAEKVEGYSANMPGNDLDDQEVEDVVAYIQELADS